MARLGGTIVACAALAGVLRVASAQAPTTPTTYATPTEALTARAEAGDRRAQFWLGFSYQVGRGVERDSEAAEKWYLRAAEGGLSEARYSLGKMLDDRREYSGALGWYEKASNQGHGPATYSLAILHDRGRGVPEDLRKGFELHLRAADMAWAEAMWSIAGRYDTDQLGARDPRGACIWTVRAQKFVRLHQQRLQADIREAVSNFQKELAADQFDACRKEADAWAPQTVWKSEVAPGIFIGQLSGIKRPDGFVVEDGRPPAAKRSWREQTYRRDPLAWGRGPQAKFRSNLGDIDLNVGSVELLADRLTELHGHKLKGSKLVVKELTVVIDTTVYKGSAAPVYGSTAGEALAGIATVLALQTLFPGPENSLQIEVRLEAELDGKRLASAQASPITARESIEAPSKFLNRTFERALENLERAEAEEAAAQSKKN